MGTKVVSMRFTEEEYEELGTLAESEGFKSKSELLRSLIRAEWDKWAERVVEHARKHPEEYTSLDELRKEMQA